MKGSFTGSDFGNGMCWTFCALKKSNGMCLEIRLQQKLSFMDVGQSQNLMA